MMNNMDVDINGSYYDDECWDNNSEFGCYWTTKFTDKFPDVDSFVHAYNTCGIEQLVSEKTIRNIYFLLYAKYGNSHFASTDMNQTIYSIFSIIFMYGPTWEKRLEIQDKLRKLSDDELILGAKQVYNHAYNPGSAPTTGSLEELKYINDQNTSTHKRSKLDAYNALTTLLETDVTKYFIDRFKNIFIYITAPQKPLWYTGKEN